MTRMTQVNLVERQNGIDRVALDELVTGIALHPEAGHVTVRTSHRWTDGLAVEGVGEQAILGGQVLDRQHHRFHTDWPEPWGTDTGPTPGAESLLAAAGACVATTFVLAATQMGVDIDELEVKVEGSVDLGRAFDEMAERPAFSSVHAAVRVHSSAPDDVIDALVRTATERSPVYQSLASPVPVGYSFERIA